MNIKIKATLREKGKKSDLNKYRREGFIPAVVYGEGHLGTSILLNALDFQKQYKKSIGEVAVYELNVEGHRIRAFIKEKQIHPVSREIIHVDFVELHKGKPITMNVPIHFAGVAKGTKEGGLLELLYRSIEITCLPKDIPDEIVIDITHLGVGESLHFKDVQLPETLNANMSDVTTIAAVRAPKKAEQPAPAGKKAEGEDAGSKSETSED